MGDREFVWLGMVAYWTCTTNADSVKSMCYFEELNNIGSFLSVL